MWDKLASFFRKVLGMTKNDAEKVAGQTLITSDMDTAIRLWMDIFYNRPPWEKEKHLHKTGFGGIATAYMASLAASEILLSCGEGVRAEFIMEQLNQTVIADLRNSIQLAGAGGQVALKPYVFGDSIYCDVLPAGNFAPIRMRGHVVEANVFWYTAIVDKTDYVRFEMHDLQPGGVQITNRCYKNEAVGPGKAVPLAAVPEWADILPDAMITGVDRPLYSFLKMPFANQVDPKSVLPVSLYASAVESLREIDRIYSEFLWEVKTGRRKQIIDVTAVTPAAPGLTAAQNKERLRKYYTSDQYLVLDMGGEAPKKPWDDYTPEMRIEKYQLAMNIQLRLFESQCQISPETFNFDVRSGRTSRPQTATEIIFDDKTTFNTIKSIQDNGLKQGLLDLVAIYDIYASLYNLAPAGKVVPTVEFGDSIFEDTGVEFQRRKALADSGYLKPELLVSWYFGVDEEKAAWMLGDHSRADPYFGA